MYFTLFSSVYQQKYFYISISTNGTVMEMSKTSEVIYGDEIFFNFIEVPFQEISQSGNLVKKIKQQQIHGFVIRDVFTTAEVDTVKEILAGLTEQDTLTTPSGQLFPAPFATMSNSDDMLKLYFDKLDLLYDLKEKQPAIKAMLEKMDQVFKSVAQDYKVGIPVNKIRHAPVAAGTFRIFLPGRGGLHVHCGNLFQAQSMHYYSLIENDIDMNDQLSYFLVLQNSEQGGELTIYDMLWQNVKRKESPEENSFVIDDDGKRIYLKDVRSFTVKPKVGDILIFSGGPIWHRVENIVGSIPRITFGGFLNFSKDDTELYYWS